MQGIIISLILMCITFGVTFVSVTEYQKEILNAQSKKLIALNTELKNKDALIMKLQQDFSVISIRLQDTEKKLLIAKTAKQEIMTGKPLNNVINQSPLESNPVQPPELKEPQTSYNYRFQCKKDGIVYFFSVGLCPSGYDSFTISSSSNKSVSQPTLNSDSEQDKYESVKEGLSKQCDHLVYGSIERRHCRADLKKGFFNKCYNKDNMPQYLRNAFCSLADNYPIVE